MPSILYNDWVLIPIVGSLVFFVFVLQMGRILEALKLRSETEKNFLYEHLDKMFVEITRERAQQLHISVSLGLGAIGFLLLWPNWVLAFVLFFVFGFVGWKLPRWILGYMWKKRCKNLVDQMVDGLTIMANGLKAGTSVNRGMERVVETLGGPLGQEFNLILTQIRIGNSLEEALQEFGRRIPMPEVQMFVSSIVILAETGGDLIETFETTSTTIRDRQKVEKKIEALTQQGVMQGIIISCVPSIILLILLVVSPELVKPLFTTTLGIILLLIVIVLQVIGAYMIRKVIEIKV